MKVLRFLSDPVNLAIRAGYTFDRDAIQGECLFAVLPELRFGHLVQHKDGRVELVQNHDDDDDDEEDYDRPEHDPSLPPEPYFLFWHSTHRLKDDGLISTRDASFDDYMEGFEEMALSFGDDRPGVDGLYPGRPFESSTELGARYLAFLTEPPANLATPGGA